MSRIIATDKDGVLVDFVRPFLRYHNHHFHTNLKYEDVFSHDISKVIRCSPEEANLRIDAFMISQYADEILPLDGAIDALRILTSKSQVHVITARPSYTKQKTLQYFNQYFPPLASVRFSDEFPKNPDFPDRTKKAQFCEQFRPDILIEDHAGNVRDCAPYCARVILFNHPWNIHEDLPDNTERVNNWNEALRILS